MQGELVKVGHPIAASTVWQILHAAGSTPLPAAPAYSPGNACADPGIPGAPPAEYRRSDRRQRGGIPEPGRGLGSPRLAGGDHPGLGEQCGQLGVI